MTDSLFPTTDDDLLISVYQKQGRTLDDLPYTTEFDRLYEAMYGPGGRDAPGGAVSRAALFHRLHNLRKAGKLPRMGKATGQRPRLDAPQETLLASLVEAEHGPLSTRDQLLYTPTFDRIAERFNTEAGLNLTHHDLWRLIAKLAK